MYTARFEGNDGSVFDFGYTNLNVFDIDGLSGYDISIGTAQGNSQVGETVERQSVGARTITVRGHIFQYLGKIKDDMRRVFRPFQRGRLIFQQKYYLDVVVKNTPTFGSEAKNGRFTMQFLAPYPFWREVETTKIYIGANLPGFRFPINYGAPHRFATTSPPRYANFNNDGAVAVPITLELTTTLTSSNITLTNLLNYKTLKFNGVLSRGEKIRMWQDESNQLQVTLEREGEQTDIISWIDEDSTLFEIEAGDNYILATDDEGGDDLTTLISYNVAVAGVYET